MSGRSPGRNRSLDLFRIVAAILIVAIHTSPLETYSELADFILTRIVARVAVPFFFLVTGYYVLPKCLGSSGKGRNQRRRSFWNYEKKNLYLYLGAILLYLPVNWYAGNLKGPWTLGGLLQELVFQGTFYHLWYLPGLLLGMLLVYGLGKLVPYRILLAISAVLYVIGLGGDSYYGLVSQWKPLEAFYGWIFAVSPYTRNGVFFAPLFLCLGYGLSRFFRRMAGGSRENSRGREEREYRELYAQRCGIGLLVFGLVMLAEGLWLHALKWQRHDSMYGALPGVMICLFSLLQTGESGEKQEKGRASRGGGFSVAVWTTWIYLLHPLGILLVRGGAKAVKLPMLIENSLLHFLAVVLVSMALATGICLFLGRLRRRE
ncbi:MAG: acyltransferase [Lachnospiraceae bacterium]|nr:acyltransferase [Lachnospiraceae bacterium]